MLDILKFYVSDFWVWLGITIGVGMVTTTLAKVIILIAWVLRNPGKSVQID